MHNLVTGAQDTASAITHYFAKATLPTQQHTLCEVVVEILNDERSLKRKASCNKLLSRLERAENTAQVTH
ncbi:two-component-system connector protein YcgZ [Yokenella regensburgei]|uniref:two-component-system connector protein YcgZ n=1 Tax=Yokenella regensburgei TaxID=158877 RepID=UPI00137599F2|nr:two-component-system connector protein YcgZ [Yokenella regensburgei]KAF1366699.1 hypothetical protein FHR25_004847 [Yokenella regensburgei]